MDNQLFYNRLGNVKEIVSSVLMVCEGMDAMDANMNERPMQYVASGVFGLMAYSMGAVYDKLSDMDTEFHNAFGVKWPVQMSEEEQKAWALERGRWI